MKTKSLPTLLLLSLGVVGALWGIGVLWVDIRESHIFIPHHFCSTIYAESGLDSDLERSDFGCWLEIQTDPAVRMVKFAWALPGEVWRMANTDAPVVPEPKPRVFALSRDDLQLRVGVCNDLHPFVLEMPDAPRPLWMVPGTYNPKSGRSTPGRYTFSATLGWKDSQGNRLDIEADSDEGLRASSVVLNLTARQLQDAFQCGF